MDTLTNDTAQAELDKKKAEQNIAAARIEGRELLVQLHEAFADDPEFAIKSFTAGKTVEQAKADYCDVLREKLKTQDAGHKSKNENRNSQISTGAEAIASGDNDEGGSGDFMTEARAMAAEKKITVTAAMKKLSRTKPELHQAFLLRCETSGKAMYAESA